MYSLSNVKDKVRKATRLLYPRGRAFKMPFDGILDRLHKALSISEAQCFLDATNTLDSAIADNPNFTADDATDWERRLGIYTSTSAISLSDRILAINRKYAHPSTVRCRQNWRYIEAQLQAAGFDVYVYENRFDDGVGGLETRTPEYFLGVSAGASFHKSTVYHKTTRYHGGVFNKKVANHINEEDDYSFVIGSNYRSTFYISSSSISTFADVDESRKDEFRQLILLLKPAQTVAFLFVNYV